MDWLTNNQVAYVSREYILANANRDPVPGRERRTVLRIPFAALEQIPTGEPL